MYALSQHLRVAQHVIPPSAWQMRCGNQRTMLHPFLLRSTFDAVIPLTTDTAQMMIPDTSSAPCRFRQRPFGWRNHWVSLLLRHPKMV